MIEEGYVVFFCPFFFVSKVSDDLRLVFDARELNLGILDTDCSLPDLFDPVKLLT